MKAIEGTYSDGKFFLREPLPEGLAPCRFLLVLEEPSRSVEGAAAHEIRIVTPPRQGWTEPRLEVVFRNDEEDWGGELDSLRLARPT